MGTQQELDRLEATIKDAQSQAKVFVMTLDGIKADLMKFEALQCILEENIDFLKTKHIIALATEYKKAKEDLATVKTKMAKARIDRDKISDALKQTQEYLTKAREAYAITLRGPQNILHFRRKDAKS